MTRRGRIALKVGAWAACLLPLGFLVQRAVTGDLGREPHQLRHELAGRLDPPDPAREPCRHAAAHRLRPVVAPRRCAACSVSSRCSTRRCTSGCGSCSTTTSTGREMGADIVKRPYITVGMAALILMLPLAATSTTAAIKRLGGRSWQRLHRLAYVIGSARCCTTSGWPRRRTPSPYYYAVVLVLLHGDPRLGLGSRP